MTITRGMFPKPLDEERLGELAELRNKYFNLLGDTFHHSSAQDLAHLGKDYKKFVEDYVSICLPEFRTEYERARKSLLESKAQTSPKLTKSPEEYGCPSFSSENAQTSTKDIAELMYSLAFSRVVLVATTSTFFLLK